jgi:dipeptidyl aminopeptidase/acylaminoacyl peptidase
LSGPEDPGNGTPARSVAPYGTWPSPLTAALAASGGPRFGDLVVGAAADGTGIVWWSTLEEGSQRVYRSTGGGPPELVGAVTSARSRVNEYGGGALWCHGDRLFFVEDADQCVYRLDSRGTRAVRLTEPPAEPRAVRHASGSVEPGGAWMVLERELHPTDGATGEPVNELALLRTDGSRPAGTFRRGADFVAAPVVSPTGDAVAWLEWNHPLMPWDGAELWAGSVREGVEGPELAGARRVAGGGGVSACLPAWSPEGTLWWCDDRDDAWLLRGAGLPGLPREGAGDDAAALRDAVAPHGTAADVGEPRWVAGGSRYGFLDDGVLLAETVAGIDHMRWLPRFGTPADSAAADAEIPVPEPTWVPLVVAGGSTAAVVAGRPTSPTTVVVKGPAGWVDMDPGDWPTGRSSISPPEPIVFPTGDGGTEVAHGILHRPRLEGVEGPAGDRPPLVVRIHGGPTAHARAELSPSVQFWTTRGFAVVEVNHRGSTGFGRAYRRMLDGGWGEVEVQDCIAAADFLGREGAVDPARCVIRGGSAGGFTALEAVCAPPTGSGFRFAAATTLYGVTDLMALAGDPHKFESRYLDGLVGRLPEARDTYEARSPIRHPERISAPVLVLQGLEDQVVPPSQAEALVAALEANGVPHEYRTYEGEGHGFRNAATVVDALEAELAFYRRVLHLAP